ncbi:hypothetical protein [Gordonia shandongensis]|uniref:hypothetical protein n=1 Tax=Gordonia shandongensis TaxID=376351 RepID=UPI00040C048D|nr:hypothetical protein [Gordonia shandongensis]
MGTKTWWVKAGTLVAGVLTAASGAAAVTAPTASAAPPSGERYVGTLRCDSPNPWPMGRLRIPVDVFTDIAHPSDGLPGPAIALKASNSVHSIMMSPEFTTLTTVRWRNRDTGRRGVVRVPSRSTRIDWEAVIHPGRGHVTFTVTQKIGAMAFVPMVNPQYSTCRGSARA